MVVTPNRFDYFKSLGDELLSQHNRVRNLIGNRHWVSDGHHKEYLLTSLLKRYIPANVILSRGFIVDPNDSELCSKEQDIIAVSTKEHGPLFNQGGLIVALSNTVIASISIKTKMTRKEIKNTVENQNTAKSVIASSAEGLPPLYCAGYFFEANESIHKNPSSVFDIYKEAVDLYPIRKLLLFQSPCLVPGPDIMCCGDKYVYTIRSENHSDSCKQKQVKILGYDCDHLAVAVFLATILDHISSYTSNRTGSLSHLVDCPSIRPLDPSCKSFE